MRAVCRAVAVTTAVLRCRCIAAERLFTHSEAIVCAINAALVGLRTIFVNAAVQCRPALVAAASAIKAPSIATAVAGTRPDVAKTACKSWVALTTTAHLFSSHLAALKHLAGFPRPVVVTTADAIHLGTMPTAFHFATVVTTVVHLAHAFASSTIASALSRAIVCTAQ